MALNKNKISFLRTDKLIEKYGDEFSAYFNTFTEQSAALMQNGMPVIGDVKKTLKQSMEAPDRYHPFATIIHQQLVKKGSNDFISNYLDTTLDEMPFPSIMVAGYLVSEFPDLVSTVDNWDEKISPYLWLANDILLNRHLAYRFPLLSIDENKVTFNKGDIFADGEFYICGHEFDAIVSSKTYGHDDERYIGVCTAFELDSKRESPAQVFEVSIFKKGVGAQVLKSEYVTFTRFGGKMTGLDINKIEIEFLECVLACLSSSHKNELVQVSDARTELIRKMAMAKSPSKKKKMISKLSYTQNHFTIKETTNG